MKSIIEKNTQGLEFDETTHTYRVDGVVYPSVTTIMQPLSQHKYGSIDESVLNKAAERGTTVHNAIEDYIKFGILDIPEEFAGYTDAYIEWNNQYSPEVKMSETKVYHKLKMYCGTVDIVALIEGEPCLIDVKTTSKIEDKLCRIQLEAYAQALKSCGVEVKDKYILHLKKDGKFEFRKYQSKDTEAWLVFDALKRVYDFNKSA